MMMKLIRSCLEGVVLCVLHWEKGSSLTQSLPKTADVSFQQQPFVSAHCAAARGSIGARHEPHVIPLIQFGNAWELYH